TRCPHSLPTRRSSDLETTQLDPDAFPSLPEERRAAYALGAEAAPLFVAFALWIAEEAQKEKLDKIYFFTREGEFFYGVFNALFRSEEHTSELQSREKL